MSTFWQPCLHALLLALLLVLFLAPGLVVAGWLHRRFDLGIAYVLPVAAGIGCLVGYATFWLALAGPAHAHRVSQLIELTAAASAVFLVAHRGWRAVLGRFDVLAPLALIYSVTLFYTGILFTCVGHSCLTTGFPVDNALPAVFAYKILIGDPRAMLDGWQFSDRPPLQTGVVLAQAVLTQHEVLANVAYQLLGTLLQCLWLAAAWALGRRLRLRPPRLAAALALCVFLGFFLLNSVYVWPKLLSAALGAFALLLVFAERPRALHWALAGGFAGTALLAHTGVIFTLLPMAALLLVRRYRPSPRVLVVAVVVVAALLLPWTLYQHVYDPPGDRLLKWHLAGAIPIDPRGFAEVMLDAYRHTPLGTLVGNRLANLGMLVSPAGASARQVEFLHVFFGLGLLNLGWLRLLRPVRRRLAALDGDLLRLLLGGALVSLLVWCLAMFGPATTAIHNGSYLTMLMLAVGLAAVVSSLPRLVVQCVLAVQIAYFLGMWVVDLWGANDVHGGWLAWTVVGLAAVTGTLWFVSRQPAPAPIPSQVDVLVARLIAEPSPIRRDYSGTRR
jgi:hypothetical protein